MRKPGRVLFSPKSVEVPTLPLSFSVGRRASMRYEIRKAVTSAVDDMIYIYKKADPKTKLHVEREAERLATGMSSVKKSLPRRSGASPDDRRLAQTVPPGGNPFHVQIEREAERVATPTDAGACATKPAPDSASGKPNGPDSVRHAGAGRPLTLGKAGSMGPEQDPAGPPPRPARHLMAPPNRRIRRRQATVPGGSHAVFSRIIGRNGGHGRTAARTAAATAFLPAAPLARRPIL